MFRARISLLASVPTGALLHFPLGCLFPTCAVAVEITQWLLMACLLIVRWRISRSSVLRASMRKVAGPVVQRPCCFRPAGVSCTPIPEFPATAAGGEQGLRVLSYAELSRQLRTYCMPFLTLSVLHGPPEVTCIPVLFMGCLPACPLRHSKLIL